MNWRCNLFRMIWVGLNREWNSRELLGWCSHFKYMNPFLLPKGNFQKKTNHNLKSWYQKKRKKILTHWNTIWPTENWETKFFRRRNGFFFYLISMTYIFRWFSIHFFLVYVSNFFLGNLSQINWIVSYFTLLPKIQHRK